MVLLLCVVVMTICDDQFVKKTTIADLNLQVIVTSPFLYTNMVNCGIQLYNLCFMLTSLMWLLRVVTQSLLPLVHDDSENGSTGG